MGRLLGWAFVVINREPYRIAIEALHIKHNDVVLELGFGAGQALAKLRLLAYAGLVLGVDQSAAMMAQARRRNNAHLSWIDLRQGRVDALPWKSNSIDKILAVNVLYFFASDGAEIAEVRRVLRRGGNMVLYATDRSSMQHWKMCTLGTHEMYDANDLRKLLRRGGFADNEIEVEQIRLRFGIRGLLAVVRKTQMEEADPSQCAIRTSATAGRVTLC
jgi:ubiquinone/menaquinone biosynthesis C-methylase UbiE